MSFFVYIRESETGKVVRFGSYDDIPFIIAQDGTQFIELTKEEFERIPLTVN